MKAAIQRAGGVVPISDDKFYLSLLAALTFLVWVAMTGFALVLHRNFLTVACDTAAMQNALFNTLHGHWFRDTAYDGPNLLAVHTCFLLLLVSPFYFVAPYPETLFVLQTLGVYSTVFPLYLLAKDFGQKPLGAFMIAGSALASSFLVQTALAPFHLETWIAAAALWSYHFYLRNNLAGFLVSFAIAVCCGEQAALIYIALGFSLLLVKDECAWRRLYGRIALLGGLFWIIFALVVVTPLASGPESFNIFAYNYGQWGVQSAAGLPAALVRHPGEVLGFLFSPYRWAHMISVVGFLGLAALFSRRSLILLAPLPAYLLMSDQEFFLYFHAYYYTFIFFAGYLGLLIFLRRLEPASRLGVLILSAYVLASLITLCCATGIYFQLAACVDEPFSAVLRTQFASIPPSATVYGPHRYSVYLSNRDNFVMGDMPQGDVDFESMVDDKFDQTNVHSWQVDYIVSDLLTDQCGLRQGYMDPEQSKARAAAVARLVDGGNWKPIFNENNVVILQRVRK